MRRVLAMSGTPRATASLAAAPPPPSPRPSRACSSGGVTPSAASSSTPPAVPIRHRDGDRDGSGVAVAVRDP